MEPVRRHLDDRNQEGFWWTWSGSNRRPLPCHGSALPAAPQAHRKDYSIFMELEQFVNQSGAQSRTLWCIGRAGPGASWQPRAATKHRPGHMFMIRPSLALLLATLSFPVSAQNDPPPASAASSVSATLRPALAQVGQSLSEIGIRHWKAPNEVRSAADQDVSSIQRDLNGPLAGLLQQADAAPGSVPAAFAVYRNVDALYDTLLRVVLTANLAAPDSEATSLQGALSNLESARTALGDSILGSSQAQQAELIRVRAALASAATVQRAPAKTTVVDDGPAKDTTTKHKKPATTKKPASTPSNPDSTSGSAPQ